MDRANGFHPLVESISWLPVPSTKSPKNSFAPFESEIACKKVAILILE